MSCGLRHILSVEVLGLQQLLDHQELPERRLAFRLSLHGKVHRRRRAGTLLGGHLARNGPSRLDQSHGQVTAQRNFSAPIGEANLKKEAGWPGWAPYQGTERGWLAQKPVFLRLHVLL